MDEEWNDEGMLVEPEEREALNDLFEDIEMDMQEIEAQINDIVDDAEPINQAEEEELAAELEALLEEAPVQGPPPRQEVRGRFNIQLIDSPPRAPQAPFVGEFSNRSADRTPLNMRDTFNITGNNSLASEIAFETSQVPFVERVAKENEAWIGSSEASPFESSGSSGGTANSANRPRFQEVSFRSLVRDVQNQEPRQESMEAENQEDLNATLNALHETLQQQINSTINLNGGINVVGVPLNEAHNQLEQLAESINEGDNIAIREDVIVQCFDPETNALTASTKLLAENNYMVDNPIAAVKKSQDKFTAAIQQVHSLYLREFANLQQLNSELLAGLSGCVLETPDDYFPLGDLGLSKEHF
ncbi:Oidioi.mRNA.OKI2018_I69.PAR.g11542.t1.cds [Oikopleura dioica]|uniref:Oidioi.mRNA.OKI2018_I69.PAR.g11542.t1.cds n=1 Tax=Oikopleura dioica TaxID=34765 RepID=A0ABN7RW90_OIKDI|nr:Oidioi.mRNA.OKI2018_I69.PAR.g11542.t1.cds [Oikopleura dioica]